MLLSDLQTFLGRLHPLVVHLPIGALILALLFDLLAYTSAARIALLIGFISAAVACVFGYLLSISADYDEEIVGRHMYAGIALAILSGILFLLSSKHKSGKIFTAGMVIMIGLLFYTGHQGGSLTYGGDYFFEARGVEGVQDPINTYDTIDMRPVDNLRSKGVTVRVMLKQPLMLDVTIMPGSHVNIEAIVNDFNPVASNIILFNASDNNLKDEDLGFLRNFVNLEKLRLEKNPVTDAVIDNLVGLKHLEAVNLYGTNITSSGVKKLKTNPAVKRVYLWGTTAE